MSDMNSKELWDAVIGGYAGYDLTKPTDILSAVSRIEKLKTLKCKGN